jgi:exopolyphosphatase/guanosine-5'-triphosphate,3'-diphosphate pyrophosphatase
MRIASIDIGTNTFRILVCELKGNDLRKVHVGRVITRLGGGFSKEKGLISPDAMERAISTLKNFADILEQYKVEKVRAVATSVVREALNGHDFLERVKSETGIWAELISGEEEAKLTVRGVLRSVPKVSEYNLIFDVGGGSTEYVYVKDGLILGLASTNLGVVHLAEFFLRHDIPSESELNLLSKHIEDTLLSQLSWASEYSVAGLSLIGTAGTPTTLAAIDMGMNNYDPDLVNGHVLKRDAVLRIFASLIKIPKGKRHGVAGLEKGREDVIIPGALIVLKTMEIFSKDRIIVSDGGLLEGVAFSIADRH